MHNTILYNSMANTHGSQTNTEQQQIIRGMLHVVVLAELTKGKKCGVDLLLALDKTPFSSKVGTLYPLLNRMEKSGFLTSDWQIQPGKTPRKYYKLTAHGTQKLQEYQAFFRQIQQYLGGKNS